MRESAERLYRWHLGLAAVATVAVGAAIIPILAGASTSVPSSAELAAACRGWLSAQSVGSLLGFALAGLFGIAVIRGVRSAAAGLSRARSFRRRWPELARRRFAGVEYCTLAAPEALAFCAGYMRPQIYLSSTAVSQLTHRELGAVLAHEDHHRRRRDPLRRLVALSLAEAFFFVPLLRRTAQRYVSLGELAADEAALGATGSRQPLAAALLKLGRHGSSAEPVIALASERVDHILGEPDIGAWSLSTPLIAASVTALLAIGSLIVLRLIGTVDPMLAPASILGAGCMLGMIAAPGIAAAIAVHASWRAWRQRGPQLEAR